MCILHNNGWTRAVWLERGKEVEGVIPSCWVDQDSVSWPNGVNADKALNEQRPPKDNWLKFQLLNFDQMSVFFHIP